MVKKIMVFLLALLLFALPALAAVEPTYVLRFPLPEDAELKEFTAGFERYQFGRTVMSTYRNLPADPDKTLEDYLTEAYTDHEEYEAFQTVDIDGNAAECGRFFYVFEGDKYPQLCAFLKTEDADYLLLIDCGSGDPEMEEIMTWMSELKLYKTGTDLVR